uniref:T9SS type A sorting domain-containing protein n=1 Tax=uncultured Draconibacterium sp. TaxID=1573823 RepID=UPI0032174C06
MKQILLILLLVFHIHFSFGQLRYSETIFEKADTIKNVEFATSEWLNNMFDVLAEYNIHSGEAKTEARPLFMDIYIPSSDTVKKRPAILFGFSGGFLKGSRHNEDMVAFCDSFARRGYVTATFDYRIGMGADITSVFGIPIHISLSETNGARAVYRAVQDSRAAVRFLKHKSEEYGIDTTKIYMVGSSAGAFVALHNLYMDKPDEIPKQALYEPSLGNLDTVGIQGYGSRANAVVSLWGALQNPDLIEDDQTPVLLVHGEKDSIVYFTKGVPLKSLVPDIPILEFGLPETYGGFCVDTALTNRNIAHSTYFVPDKKHEFYGVSTGNFGSNGPNQYWDSVQWEISDFLFDIFKPTARFEAFNIERDVSFTNSSSAKYYAHWDFGDGGTSNAINPVHRFQESGYHHIKLTACNENMACDTLSQTIFLNPLAMDDINQQKISIYPNPADKHITIAGIKPIDKTQIFDLWGRIQILKSQTDYNTIDISHLHPGIYFLKIETSEAILIQKFQKIN